MTSNLTWPGLSSNDLWLHMDLTCQCPRGFKTLVLVSDLRRMTWDLTCLKGLEIWLGFTANDLRLDMDLSRMTQYLTWLTSICLHSIYINRRINTFALILDRKWLNWHLLASSVPCSWLTWTLPAAYVERDMVNCFRNGSMALFIVGSQNWRAKWGNVWRGCVFLSLYSSGLTCREWPLSCMVRGRRGRG